MSAAIFFLAVAVVAVWRERYSKEHVFFVKLAASYPAAANEIKGKSILGMKGSAIRWYIEEERYKVLGKLPDELEKLVNLLSKRYRQRQMRSVLGPYAILLFFLITLVLEHFFK